MSRQTGKNRAEKFSFGGARHLSFLIRFRRTPWSLDAATKIKSEPVQPDRPSFNDERGVAGVQTSEMLSHNRRHHTRSSIR
jgi:hypothetical protein